MRFSASVPGSTPSTRLKNDSPTGSGHYLLQTGANRTKRDDIEKIKVGFKFL